MKQNGMAHTHTNPLNILLAEDDADDRYFFDRILKTLPIPTRLITVEDGEVLMTYLSKNSENLPDVLFLDLNMPRKNGAECLSEIKHNKKLKHLPVVIYSTHLHERDDDLLYEEGAHYYIRKTDIIELTRVLHRVLNRMIVNKFARPSPDKFIFTMETI
jgi:CheY-like chemotaxis protein